MSNEYIGKRSMPILVERNVLNEGVRNYLNVLGTLLRTIDTTIIRIISQRQVELEDNIDDEDIYNSLKEYYCDVLNGLIGIGLVVCQTYMNTILNNAIKILDDISKYRIYDKKITKVEDKYKAIIEWYYRKNSHELHVLHLINPLANYYKHSDTWEYGWEQKYLNYKSLPSRPKPTSYFKTLHELDTCGLLSDFPSIDFQSVLCELNPKRELRLKFFHREIMLFALNLETITEMYQKLWERTYEPDYFDGES
jgi:hypothetical protein